MDRMNGETLNIVSDNIQKLKEIFPEVFNEDKVDFEKLESVLGEYKDNGNERYNFSWPGKSKAIRIAQTPSTGTLRPCKEESKDWDTTQNLYIEGDNLEVLKLLQKSYYGKVKMIYIDPPYNTGNDFVYKDDFKDNIENYLEVTGQKDSEGNKTTTNTESNGRYHSNWINLMYPRLKLARNLLCNEGFIFISIDDNEITNLRRVCDEIFGEENFLVQIVWQKRTSPDARKKLSTGHEYIVVYMKDARLSEEILNYSEITNEDADKYRNPDNDSRGPWVSTDFGAQGYRPNQMYKIITPSGKEYYPSEGRCWKNTEEAYFKLLNEGRMWFGSDGSGVPRKKLYLFEREGKSTWSWWSNIEAGHTQEATQQLTKLLGKKTIFDYPKPVRLIRKIIKLATKPNDIVLDFFSGSATTAHAVMELNCTDEYQRKFIMVQIPEICEENSDAYKQEYKTICDIGKERIHRAGEQIISENNIKIDIGFKVFKLDSSNINRWNSSYEQDLEENLFSSIENIKEGRTEEDILYEILLKYGIDLNMPIEEHIIEGKKVFDIGFGAIIACLDENISLEVVEGIGKLKEALNPDTCRVVFMDNGFSGDSVKTNAVQILKRYNIEDVKSI